MFMTLVILVTSQRKSQTISIWNKWNDFFFLCKYNDRTDSRVWDSNPLGSWSDLSFIIFRNASIYLGLRRMLPAQWLFEIFPLSIWQCDQMATLLCFQFWPFTTMKLCPIASKKIQNFAKYWISCEQLDKVV